MTPDNIALSKLTYISKNGKKQELNGVVDAELLTTDEEDSYGEKYISSYNGSVSFTIKNVPIKKYYKVKKGRRYIYKYRMKYLPLNEFFNKYINPFSVGD